MLPLLQFDSFGGGAGCGDPNASFFGFLGITIAVSFANLGAAYGTAKSGVGIASMGTLYPELVMRNMIPVVMAGVLGIYGLIVAVILNGKMSAKGYGTYDGYAHLAAGMSCGLAGLGAGLAIGVVGDAGTRSNAVQKNLFVSMILILIFAEALGLYGLIVAIVLTQNESNCP